MRSGKVIYSYMLVGMPYSRRRWMSARGWTWLRGVGSSMSGVYQTSDIEAARAVAAEGIPVVSNGTHALTGAPMSLQEV